MPISRPASSLVPSNSLASLHGLIQECARNRVLGPDVTIEVDACDECNTVVNVAAVARRIQAAGRYTGERVWQLPLDPFYDKMIRSKIADMKNIGGANSGAITAAQFLQRFIEKDMVWAHLDIAGVAWQDGEQKPTIPSWGTGWGVRLLNRLVKEHYEG